MSNTVVAIGESMRFFHWSLENNLGIGFEDFIFELVLQHLHKQYPQGIRVFHTPHTNDGGKDIVIKSDIDIDGLFCQRYSRNGKKEITIYIECKSTNHGKLRFEKAICNVERIKGLEIDYYVLVTNSTITPYTYYTIDRELKAHDTAFMLVDQYVLLSYCKRLNISLGHYVEPQSVPTINAYYQVYQTAENGCDVLDLYVLCRNYGSANHLGKIQLLTDRNWTVDNLEQDFLLAPYCSHIEKYRIRHNFFDGIEDLYFSLKIGETETPLHIRCPSLTVEFETPLIGDGHYHCLNQLTSEISSATGLQVYYLWGEAGIGKTRIANEVYRRLAGSRYDFGFFRVGQGDLISNINAFLTKKAYTTKSLISASLSQIICSCSHTYRRAVLVLDDIHNLPKATIQELKSLIEMQVSLPVTIILCGRTDYSAGSLDYFTFVHWCIENQNLDGYTVPPLTTAETKKLIKIIINEVPQIVEDRLCAVSKNNPQFIVQYIEYLLEIKLVQLVNRNTVGIPNVATFAAKTYIPESIHELYTQRHNNLLQQPNGKELQNLLLIVCLLGGSISTQKVIRVLDENTADLLELVRRNYLQIDTNGEICFTHESIYLYYSKCLNDDKELHVFFSDYLLSNLRYLVESLPPYKQGMIYAWHGDYAIAENHFSSVVRQLSAIKNFSNIEIDPSVYDYLYIVFDLFEDKRDIVLIKNIIMARIYITLHHKAPINAISECDYALQRIKRVRCLSQDIRFRNSILEQKAHSMFHAGMLVDGELILRELLSTWLWDKNIMDSSALFDMMDRLSGVYIKYNLFDLAQIYNDLSFGEAKRCSDNKMLSIAWLTKSKLLFYSNPEESRECLQQVVDIAQQEKSQRIECSAMLSILILDIVHNKNCNWSKSMEKASYLLKQAVQSNYTTSIIRAYMVLAVCSFHLEQSSALDLTRDFISKGIDASIEFGVSTYIWQFYNLLGIVELNLGYDSEHTYRTFMTAYSILAKQNLLYLGSLELCYGNALVISNIGFFLQSHKFETEFYKQLSRVTYKNLNTACDFDCGKHACCYICNDSIKRVKDAYMDARERRLLFVTGTPHHLLRDEKTEYYIVLS